MRLNKITGSLIAGAMTLGVISVAVARTGTVLGATTPRLFGQAPTGGGSPGGSAGGMVKTEREVGLTPDQQVERGRQHMASMGEVAGKVKAMLEQARAAKDVVRVLCLNDKSNQIGVAQRSAKDRMAALTSAASSKDKDLCRHEFEILAVLKERVDTLGKEANQCIGDEAGYLGETQVTLSVNPNIPDNNLDQIGNDSEVPGLDTPVLSSPPL